MSAEPHKANDQTPAHREARPNGLLPRWWWKFACALRGIAVGMRGQSSFHVHLPAAALVLVVGMWLNVSRLEWLVLLLCITAVLAAELFNSSIEHLSRAVTREEHPEVRDALDIASGAVLVVALGAAVVGVLVVL